MNSGEFSELRYACLGDDAEALSGTRRASNEACAYMDELIAEARAHGMCWDVAVAEWGVCS